MKLYKNLIYVLLLSAGLTATSCVGDLDVTPIDPSTNTSDKALNSAADFKAIFGTVLYWICYKWILWS